MFQMRLLGIIALLQNSNHLVYGLCHCTVPGKWNFRSVVRYLKQVTSNKIQLIQGLQSPVNCRMFTGEGSRQCLMRSIVDGVLPKSHNKASLGRLDWVQSLLLNMLSNHRLSDWVQLLPQNASTDMRYNDYMFRCHKGDQLGWGLRIKCLRESGSVL